MTVARPEYPKCKYNDPNNHESYVVVNSREEEDALGPEWKDHWLECGRKEDPQPDTTAQDLEDANADSAELAEEQEEPAVATKPAKKAAKKAAKKSAEK